MFLIFFFFNDTATTEIYTLSLHDALPISMKSSICGIFLTSIRSTAPSWPFAECSSSTRTIRSEEHTSELQSQSNLVCRLLLEKKKRNKRPQASIYEEHPCTRQSRVL